MNIADYLQKGGDLIMRYAGTVILAIVVLIVGLWIIKRIVKALGRLMEKKDVDATLRPFLKAISSALLKIMLIIAVASMIGIKMTSFIAVLGAAGLAVGLALQGSLANFAGGVLILLLKPFKVGDFIEGAGHAGTVREIHIFYTFVTKTTGQEIIIPNGKLANTSVINYSWHDTRRMDMTFRITYKDSIDKAKEILEEIITAEDTLLKDPAHSVYVTSLDESYVTFNVRAWFKSSDYWDVYNSLSEKVRKRFDKEGIGVPYPVVDVQAQDNKTN